MGSAVRPESCRRAMLAALAFSAMLSTLVKPRPVGSSLQQQPQAVGGMRADGHVYGAKVVHNKQPGLSLLAVLAALASRALLSAPGPAPPNWVISAASLVGESWLGSGSR